MTSVSKVNFLCRQISWTVSGPSNKEPTEENIRDHVKTKNTGFFGKRSVLEYSGAGGFILGGLLWILGKRNESKPTKWTGFLASLAGIVSTLVGILLDPLDELHSRIIF